MLLTEQKCNIKKYTASEMPALFSQARPSQSDARSKPHITAYTK